MNTGITSGWATSASLPTPGWARQERVGIVALVARALGVHAEHGVGLAQDADHAIERVVVHPPALGLAEDRRVHRAGRDRGVDHDAERLVVEEVRPHREVQALGPRHRPHVEREQHRVLIEVAAVVGHQHDAALGAQLHDLV